MGASGVNGGRVLSAALANELVEPVAEVLHLAGSQDAAHPHQLGVVRVVVTPSRARVGVTTNSQRSPLDLQRFSESSRAGRRRPHARGRRVSEETGQPFGGWAGSRRSGLASRRHGGVLCQVKEFVEEVQPEKKTQVGEKLRKGSRTSVTLKILSNRPNPCFFFYSQIDRKDEHSLPQLLH